MNSLDIAGLRLSSLTKDELKNKIQARIRAGQKTWLTTLYSEFLYHSLKNSSTKDLLNRADIAVPDGIAMFWAKRYLELSFTTNNYYLKILQAYWQALYSSAAILFRSHWIRSALPEKISGSDLIWDITKLAAEHKFSIYLLGGFGNTPQVTANQLISRSANQLIIVGTSSKNPDDPTVMADIRKANPDILLVAYGPIKQEQWIAAHMQELPAKLYIGLGGTFDYVAGKRKNPPAWVRQSGLEWLFRLITQPHRVARIYNATFGLIDLLVHYKVFESLALRRNVVAAIINHENKILICKRNPLDPDRKFFGLHSIDLLNYWQLPQGGADDNESYAQTALRESREETGLTNLEVLSISTQTHTYHWNNARRPFLGQVSKLKGQEQHIIYLRHLGQDTDIRIDHDEFVEYKWIPIQDLETAVHSLRKPLARIIQTDLKELFKKAII